MLGDEIARAGKNSRWLNATGSGNRNGRRFESGVATSVVMKNER